MKRERKLGRLRLEFFTSDMNWHGPRISENPPKFETLRRGWKVVPLGVDNPIRSYWGRRFIRYHADGSWWAFSVFWMLRGEFGR